MSVSFATVEEAKKSLKKNNFYFGKMGTKNNGEKGWIHANTPHDLEELRTGFANIAAFLCNSNAFETALTNVSRDMWNYYRILPPQTRNKFTRAMGLLAMSKQFKFQENLSIDTSKRNIDLGAPVGIKLIGGDSFLGYLLRNKLFWKDSMDVRHGEHSHSLQWLAIAEHFNGNPLFQTITIPDYYALTADVGAETLGGNGVLRIWQWLADCFPTQLGNNADTLKTGEQNISDTYRSPQIITDYLLGKSTNQPLAGHFISNYLFHRYRNRGWLISNGPLISKHYTGTSPKSYKKDDWATQGWQQALKPTGMVNPARMQRTPGTYQIKRSDDQHYEQHKVTFHNQPGHMRFYTTLA